MGRPKASAKTETLERFDPKEDFSDVDGDLNNEFALTEEEHNSDRRALWVHNNADAIREYRTGVLKYQPVHDAEGNIITRRDHILMDCDRALFNKRDRYERLENLKQRALMSKQGQKDLKVYEQGARE